MEALPAGLWPEDEALFETLNQYFVIEIWVERAASVEAPAAWRARVTHGPSGGGVDSGDRGGGGAG